MMIWANLSLAVVLVAQFNGQEKLAQDSGNLKNLLSDVRKALPRTWSAEITPDIPPEFVRGNLSDQPCLVAWRRQKALGRWHVANRASGEQTPVKPVDIYFTLMLGMYFSPQEYRKMAEINSQYEDRRLAIARALIKDGVSWAFMGPEPIPPRAFDPKTPEQTERVRQYALLWMRTPRTALPTHHYRTLSLSADFDDALEPQDRSIAAERNRVRAAVENIVTAYDKRPD